MPESPPRSVSLRRAILTRLGLLVSGKAPHLDNPERFNRLFKPVLETLPQFTSVVAGTSTGQGWLLLQLPDGHWRNRMTDIPRRGKRQLLLHHRPDRQVDAQWQELDCDEAQGYHFGRPMPADEFARAWLRPRDEGGATP